MQVTVTYISRPSDFPYISWRLFDRWTSNFHIMSQCGWTFDLKINIGQYDLYFAVHWFLLMSWRLLEGWTSYFGIMSQCDANFDLKIHLGHNDLFFMVQWFCLISWRLLFDSRCSGYVCLFFIFYSTVRSKLSKFHMFIYFPFFLNFTHHDLKNRNSAAEF